MAQACLCFRVSAPPARPGTLVTRWQVLGRPGRLGAMNVDGCARCVTKQSSQPPRPPAANNHSVFHCLTDHADRAWRPAGRECSPPPLCGAGRRRRGGARGARFGRLVKRPDAARAGDPGRVWPLGSLRRVASERLRRVSSSSHPAAPTRWAAQAPSGRRLSHRDSDSRTASQ